jgi:hypothetical protein
MIKGFLAHAELDGELLRHKLREVVEFKIRDPNISPTERLAMWRVVEQFETPT